MTSREFSYPVLFYLARQDEYMFADDSNLFYSHENIETLFTTANKELLSINNWFKCNKRSLNASKTKYVLFHKSSAAHKLPSSLPDLIFNNTKIHRHNTVQFLGVTIDEHLSWRMQICNIEKKFLKESVFYFEPDLT